MEMSREDILAAIKEKVISVLPDAKVMLFGSRARGDWHKESDWDILVLTDKEVTYKLENIIYDAVYPINLQMLSIVSLTIANKKEWDDHPGWYSLSLSITNDLIVL